VSLEAFAGKRKVLNIVPSLDTPTCQKSTRVFNEKAPRSAMPSCWWCPPIRRDGAVLRCGGAD
jgi:hypothetical protein